MVSPARAVLELCSMEWWSSIQYLWEELEQDCKGFPTLLIPRCQCCAITTSLQLQGTSRFVSVNDGKLCMKHRNQVVHTCYKSSIQKLWKKLFWTHFNTLDLSLPPQRPYFPVNAMHWLNGEQVQSMHISRQEFLFSPWRHRLWQNMRCLAEVCLSETCKAVVNEEMYSNTKPLMPTFSLFLP